MRAARRHLLATVASWPLLLLGQPTQLPGQEPASDSWHARAAGFLWFAAVEGEAGLANVTIPVTDTALYAGYTVRVEATRKRWSALLELSHNTVTAAPPEGSGADRFDFGFTSLEAAGAFRLDRIPSSAAVVVRAGGRYVRHRLELPLAVPGDPRETVVEDWIEPFAGFRFVTSIGDRFSFRLDGSVGGIGLGPDFVWVVDGEFDAALFPRMHLIARYRYFESEYDADPGGYRWDGRTQGWLFGLGYEL